MTTLHRRTAGPLAAAGDRRTRRGAEPMAALLLALMALVGFLAMTGAASGRSPAAGPPAVETDDVGARIVIGPGETPWEALKEHAPEGAAHPAFVHEVLQVNDVDARHLRPGDVLVVPRSALR